MLKVDFTNAIRPAAVVLASGLVAPQQVFLDETHHQAYIVEFANPGRLIRVDLNTLQKIVLINGLNNAVGLLVSSDLAYTYISEQSGGGRITRYSLQGGVPMVIASGLTNPFFLKWLDAAQSTIILPERDPTNHITLVDTVLTPVVFESWRIWDLNSYLLAKNMFTLYEQEFEPLQGVTVRAHVFCIFFWFNGLFGFRRT